MGINRYYQSNEILMAALQIQPVRAKPQTRKYERETETEENEQRNLFL